MSNAFEHDTSIDFLKNDGPLSLIISNFKCRPEQEKMAEAIEAAIVSHQKLIIEAGTGIGKTFAYLIPAFLSDQKIIISTGTKNLQSQLFDRDIPLIKQVLNSVKKVLLLKGRANYLCLYQLDRNLHEGLFCSKQVIHELELIRKWSNSTQTGDIIELNDIPEDSMVWPYATSNKDNCLGSDCPCYDKCYVLKARREAQDADILVVNHHLFIADLVLKDEGFDDLLPGAMSVIFDEAHQLPQTATNFFGMMISSHQIIELAHDIRREYLFTAKDVRELETIFERLQRSVQDCRLTFGEESKRGSWNEISNTSAISSALDHVIAQLDFAAQILGQLIMRSKGLENCWRRCIDISARLKLFFNSNPKEEVIRWFETYSKSFILRITPINISEIFQTSMKRYDGAWIFTSATISVADNFMYFAENLGLLDAKTLQLSSSFDYEKQALLYMPLSLPMVTS